MQKLGRGAEIGELGGSMIRSVRARDITIQPGPGHEGMALHRNPWHDLEGSPADELHAAVIAAEVSYAGELAVQAYLDRLGCGNDEDIGQIAGALRSRAVFNTSCSSCRREKSKIPCLPAFMRQP